MSKLRRLLVCVLLAALSLTLFAGCSKASKKSWLYSCDPDNMLGLEGYYYKDDQLHIVFNTDYRSKKNRPEGLYYVKKEGEFGPYNKIRVYIEDEDSYEPRMKKVDLEEKGEQLIVSFKMDKDDAKNITGFSFHLGFDYSIDIDEGEIEAVQWGGECADYYRQHYNDEEDKWSEIENDFVLYPMTENVEDY